MGAFHKISTPVRPSSEDLRHLYFIGCACAIGMDWKNGDMDHHDRHNGHTGRQKCNHATILSQMQWNVIQVGENM